MADDVAEYAPVGFTGTPSEVEAWLRRYVGGMRSYLVGRTSVDDGDGRLVPGEDQRRVLDAFERSMWRVTLVPTDGVARHRVRDDLVPDVERIREERDLVGAILASGGTNG